MTLAQRKFCAMCGVELTNTAERFRHPLSNRFYCYACWKGTGPNSVAGAEGGPSLEGLDELAELEAAAPGGSAAQHTFCTQCGKPYYRKLGQSRGKCFECKRRSLLRIWLPIVGSGIVGIVGLILFSNFGVHPPDSGAEVSTPPPAASPPAAPEANPAPAMPTAGAQAAQLETALKQNYADAAQARQAGDTVRLLQLQQSRDDLLAGVTRDMSPFLDQWMDDSLAIAQGERQLSRMKYDAAVKTVMDRWNQRKDATPMDGRLGVELVQLSLESLPVQRRSVLPDSQMQAVLAQVLEKDPAQMLAPVLWAWTRPDDPAEELLRLEDRRSARQIDQSILPIRSALEPGIGDLAGDLPEFQSGLKPPAGVSLSTFRAVLSASDDRLGQSRQQVQTDAEWWTHWLANESLPLQDLANEPMWVIDGGLWRCPVIDGIRRWQLLKSADQSGQWIPITLTLLRFDAAGNSASADDQTLWKDLENRTAAGDAFHAISGHQVAIVTPDEADLPKIMQSAVPTFFVSASADDAVRQLRFAWTAANRISDAQYRGTSLVLDRHLIADLPNSAWIQTLDQPSVSSGKLNILNLAQFPVVAVFAVGKPTAIPGIDRDKGFFDSEVNAIRFNAANMLQVRSPGGGSVVIPLLGSRFDDVGFQSTLHRLIAQLDTPNSVPASVKDLAGLLTTHCPDEVIAADQVAQAIATDDDKMLETFAGTDDEVRTKFLFHYDIWQARKTVARIRLGADAHGRTVFLDPNTSNPTLRLLDNEGNALNAFYSPDELAKLAQSTANDYFLPSEKLVPSPLVRSMAGGRDIREFLLSEATRASTSGSLHRAAVYSREADVPLRPYADFGVFDSRRSMKHDDGLRLLDTLSKTAQAGEANLRARIMFADLLRRSGRVDQAMQVLRCAKAEWNTSGLPLLDEIQQYADSYGYSPDPTFASSYKSISDQLALLQLPDSASVAADMQAGNAPFDAGQAADALSHGILESWLDNFYDQRPSLGEFAAAKRWLLANQPAMLLRAPRRPSDYAMRFWTPMVFDNRGHLAHLTWDQVANAKPGGDSPAADWLDVEYAVETSPTDDCFSIRNRTLALAETFRKQGQGPSTDKTANLANLNAIAVMGLATQIDADLSDASGTAGLGPFADSAGRLEWEAFIRPRLERIGLSAGELQQSAADLERLLQSADAVEQHRESAYRRRRFYWTDYEPLVDGYCNFIKGLPIQ